MQRKIKTPRSIAQIMADPRVTDFSDERSAQSGLWVYLVAGLKSGSTGTHQIAEDTVAELIEEFKSIEKCDCLDCKTFIDHKDDEALSMAEKSKRVKLNAI